MHLSAEIRKNRCTLAVVSNLPLCVFEGAAIAKKKMMKKFGWYKHSEDGGGRTAVIRGMFTGLVWSYCQCLCVFSTESDSDDDIAYLDDDSGFCASLM